MGIIGAGAWGTTLGCMLQESGLKPVIWAHDPKVAESIRTRHENPRYLPGVPLDPALAATDDLARAAEAGLLLLVVPAQHMRGVLSRLKAHIEPGTPVVVCAKGIERESGALMSEVVRECLGEVPLAVLSGPTFAAEVARGLPTAVTIACAEIEQASELAKALGSPTFRPYASDDVVGAQVGGAVKNVLAIACGVAKGRGLGENARAALITRGFAEMARFGRALMARNETLTGLSGLGDLVLTCTSEQSRNTSLGVALGQGLPLESILARRPSVAEGVATAPALCARARKAGVEMPIAEAVDGILHRGADIDATIGALLARPFKSEAGFVLDRVGGSG